MHHAPSATCATRKPKSLKPISGLRELRVVLRQSYQLYRYDPPRRILTKPSSGPLGSTAGLWL